MAAVCDWPRLSDWFPAKDWLCSSVTDWLCGSVTACLQDWSYLCGYLRIYSFIIPTRSSGWSFCQHMHLLPLVYIDAPNVEKSLTDSSIKGVCAAHLNLPVEIFIGFLTISPPIHIIEKSTRTTIAKIKESLHILEGGLLLYHGKETTHNETELIN